jgi:alkaline phosphatase D
MIEILTSRKAPVSRRDFLRATSGAAGCILLGGLPARAADVGLRLRAFPFTLGIASGDPTATGVVLWTRLAPAGEVLRARVPVRWEVARDEAFGRIVARGSVLATPELGHAVHAEVEGLEPAYTYFYRFIADGEASPVGRTRTAAAGAADAVRFAFVSCQHFEQGLYTAYGHLADEDVDLVVHLGDYIYENGPAGSTSGRPRLHDAPEIVTLDDYRNRYALYKRDALLQAAHAAFPFVVTPDDHEVDNNFAGDVPEEPAPEVDFVQRKVAAYQAYYEHMPLRRTSLPNGPGMRLYRALDYGTLLRFHVLDTRQHRTDQPCGDGMRAGCAAAADPAATILGDAQERWLVDGLRGTRARWNVLANQVPVAPTGRLRGGVREESMDKWGAYLADRARLIESFRARPDANPVVITGDVHVSWVADVTTDFDDARAPVVASELVGTSISSGGDGRAGTGSEPTLRDNPHLSFFDARRGYVRCTVTPGRLTADYRVVDYVTRPGAPVTTAASFVVENGRPGAERAG